MIEKYFAVTDRNAIQEAVASGERRISGEIVPYVVASSHDYPEAIWRGAAACAFLLVTVYAIAPHIGWSWGMDPLWVLGTALLGAGFGSSMILTCPFMRRLFIGSRRMAWMVQEQARQAFLKEEVFATTQRTGILIFLSLFERRVTILADSGIAKKVGESEWQGISDAVAQGIRDKRAGDALSKAIGQCADLLVKHGFLHSPTDRNELSDGLRTSEETR